MFYRSKLLGRNYLRFQDKKYPDQGLDTRLSRAKSNRTRALEPPCSRSNRETKASMPHFANPQYREIGWMIRRYLVSILKINKQFRNRVLSEFCGLNVIWQKRDQLNITLGKFFDLLR